MYQINETINETVNETIKQLIKQLYIGKQQKINN